MQSKPDQITANFAPETQFQIELRLDAHPVELSDLLVFATPEQPVNLSMKSLDHRGIPFSAIND